MTEWFSVVPWHEMFALDTPLLEIFVRGSVMYLSLFFLLRFVLKRQTGSVGVTDLLVIVLIADASQNGMAGDYHSLPDGIALVATLIFWNVALEWLGFQFPWFDKLICPAPLPLIKNGRMLYSNMRRELITKDDLMSHLRQQGIDNIAKVKQACMEGDGKISVIEHKKTKRKPKPKGSAPG